MAGKENIAFMQLFWDLMNRRTGELGKVDFIPQKPAYDYELPMEQPFPRSTPEEQGVDSGWVADFVKEMGENPHVHMHQMMILRHDHVIFECGFDPYPAGIWHVTYSMCKSFTNMAIGLLVDEGKLSLEDKVVDLLANRFSALQLLNILWFKDITVRHLLTMSTGVSFNEVGAISGNDWVKGYFDSSLKFTPGTKFEYNSMNTFILSAIVSEITGMTMFDFLKERLFDPMGIKKVFWETSPKGITKAGWGMFITQEDAAKLGSLYLHKGMWNGQQLISGEWVEASTSSQIQTDKPGNPEYGYQIWMDCRPGSFCYNGMLGQNVHVYPDLDMIVITNAGNEEVFQTGNMTSILRKYCALPWQPSTEPLPENIPASRRLSQVKAQMECTAQLGSRIQKGGWALRSDKQPLKRRKRGSALTADAYGRYEYASASQRNTWQGMLRGLDGKTFEMDEKSIGLFPLIMQVVHNNYTHGISKMRFRMQDGMFYIDFLEGAQTHSLPVGFTKGRHSIINMNGEEYFVGVKGRIHTNEDGVPVMSLQIAFIEEATERRLKILFLNDHQLELHWDEIPGNMIIADTLEMITMGSGNTGSIVNGIMSQISPDLIRRTMQSAIQPVVRAQLVQEMQEEESVKEEDAEGTEDAADASES